MPMSEVMPKEFAALWVRPASLRAFDCFIAR
jgi:hypothetical protein